MKLTTILIYLIVSSYILSQSNQQNIIKEKQQQMQDSFLENDDEEYKQEGERKIVRIPHPEKKMYTSEIGQMEEFGKKIKAIHEAINNVLVELNKCEEGERRRFPYFLLKKIEKVGKDMKILKEDISIKNQSYSQHVSQREKDKQARNALFKLYLKQYGNKREELKAYMNKVQTRVRKLEDSGYAQYIEYDVIVPQMQTIRFSYSSKTLLNLIKLRNQFTVKVKEEIAKRKQLQKIIFLKLEKSKQKQQIPTQDNDSKQDEIQKCQVQQRKMLDSQGLKLQTNQEERKSKHIVFNQERRRINGLEFADVAQAINVFQTYKHFCNNRILLVNIFRLRQSKDQLQLQIAQLQKSVKSIKQHLYKTELKVGVLYKDPKFTKTDHFILLKQYQLEIRQRLESKIFQRRDAGQMSVKRTDSWPKIKN